MCTIEEVREVVRKELPSKRNTVFLNLLSAGIFTLIGWPEWIE